jgi:malonyl-CoA/methylmalonyl-CoA synthetase
LTDLAEGGTLPGLWANRWSAHPEQRVLSAGADPTRFLSGASLLDRTAAAAAALARAGAGAGERVLWPAAPSFDAVVALLGALRLGAVVVPVSATMTSHELSYLVGDVRPSVALVDRAERGEWIRAADDRVRVLPLPDLAAGDAPTGGHPPVLDSASPDDDALIVYTSGTTGQPKGAVHTHRSLLAGVHAVRLAWGWQPDDHLILALPLFHVHGLCAGLFGTLAAGASATLFERFAPAPVLDAVPRSTMFFGVPTMYHRLAESGRAAELAPLRLCVSGSAPLPADLWHRLHHESGVAVLERYGMSETLLTLSNPLGGERRPGSVGLPLPGVETRLADTDEGGVGQLLVRGPSLCRGYWDRPEAEGAASQAGGWAPTGWFPTGDLASVHDDGYVTIRGRLTELIITGGHNVYPAEVEAVLLAHPSVKEIAVIGIASDEWGESVTAVVVGADGGVDLAGIAALAERELAPYKRPREFRVVDELPRNAMGKVVRRDLA